MHDIDNELKLMLDGKFDEARKISDKLQDLGPEGIPDPQGNLGNPEMWIRHSFNRGWFLIQDGDYQGGCQLLESGRFINVYGSQPLKTDAPIFNPNEHDIKGKSIIISLEGGFGDEIIHARFCKSYKDLGADKVYLAPSPELLSVCERIEGCDGVILRNQAHTVAHDYWVPGFSAGWIAGHTFENFPNDPYISARPESVEIWKSMINADKLKVGIRWAGNPKFEHQQFRRFPPNFLTELSKYENVQLYSLQRDQNIIDLPENIIDLQHLLISWEDTLAAISNLDIVITSCTSIAHMAAALGKETWVLVPILPYHTWTYGAPLAQSSPYYKSVRLFRQDEPDKWNTTFQRLYSSFEERFGLEHIDHPSHDKVTKKLNLGCGYNKLDGYINVDMDSTFGPDMIGNVDEGLPFEEGELQHIVAKDVLEYTQKPLLDVIKELYRVSENGTVWEVQVPHHRSDTSLNNPSITKVISPDMFKTFDQKKVHDNIKYYGSTETPTAILEGIDMDVCEVKYEYHDFWVDRVRNNDISFDQLNEHVLYTQNNVAKNTQILLQVHKPPRYTLDEIKKVIEDRNS